MTIRSTSRTGLLYKAYPVLSEVFRNGVFAGRSAYIGQNGHGHGGPVRQGADRSNFEFTARSAALCPGHPRDSVIELRRVPKAPHGEDVADVGLRERDPVRAADDRAGRERDVDLDRDGDAPGRGVDDLPDPAAGGDRDTAAGGGVGEGRRAAAAEDQVGDLLRLGGVDHDGRRAALDLVPQREEDVSFD